MERHRQTVIGKREIIGQQSVHRERLIQAFFQQAFEYQFTETVGRNALEQVGIQAVEGAQATEHQLTTLDRLRIDVIEMIEIRRVFGIIPHAHRRYRECRHRHADHQHRCITAQSGSVADRRAWFFHLLRFSV